MCLLLFQANMVEMRAEKVQGEEARQVLEMTPFVGNSAVDNAVAFPTNEMSHVSI